MRLVADKVRVEISARLLGGNDVRCQRLDVTAQLLLAGIGSLIGSQGPGSRLDPFIKVGIGVNGSLARQIGASGQAAEVIYDAVLFQKLQHGRQAALGSDLAASGPEAIAEVLGLDRNRVQARIQRMIEIYHPFALPNVGARLLRVENQ